MSDYADYRVSQARLDRVRQRAARQKRAALFALVLVAALAFVFAVASSWRGEKVPPPRVVLAWPSPQKYGVAELGGPAADGSARLLGNFLLRRGQPFSVELRDAAKWDASFISGETRTQGNKARWQPNKDGETLKIFVRPQVRGWRKLFAWTTQNQEMRLVARDAKSLDANRREIIVKTKHQVRLSRNVWTNFDTSRWDQRAIPLVESTQKIARRWQIARGFNSSPSPGDVGTYLSTDLQKDAAIEMTKIAREIAAGAPKTNIKWVLNDKRAMLRLEFDDSGARGGWVKNAGETQATPLRWWDENLGESEIRERVAPSLPR